MDINNETLDHLADLAELEFNEAEKENIKNDLNRILTYFDKLNEVDTNSVEPLIFLSDNLNVLREDEAKTEFTKVEALLNATAKDRDYFRVPKFIEK